MQLCQYHKKLRVSQKNWWPLLSQRQRQGHGLAYFQHLTEQVRVKALLICVSNVESGDELLLERVLILPFLTLKHCNFLKSKSTQFFKLLAELMCLEPPEFRVNLLLLFVLVALSSSSN